ncbi:uncharacterized protein LOC121529560 [Cheilinus undulatus]|uniref:uncharacterized protein LOC121529560 n=1 Tax=Cheilinus undulatus TaxID=241271 RepID=UPI001BD20744|nr:uncharacterized protein LOC121529560 [Cheilinus undulatus]
MSASREKTRDAMFRYTIETLFYIEKVKQFCESFPEWMDARTTEVFKMEGIKTSYSRIDLGINHITKSEKKGKAFLEYMENKVTQVTRESVKKRRARLERELDAVLAETLSGLKKLHFFLEAVEKLAVTSLHVFQEGNRVLQLPRGAKLEHVQVVIAAARRICPLLLEFKRDASAFFLPKLDNVDVLVYQLDRYIQTTQKICENLNMSLFSHLPLQMSSNVYVNLDENFTHDEVQRMFHHIRHLTDMRMDPDFRLVFLFQDVSCSGFVKEFIKRQPRMLNFLEDLEKTAVQLDSMNKGAKISSTVGSSVGAIGGVLSIIGLALIPVTAGVSLSLTIAGMGCGVASGLNSIVTTATEIGVNRTQQDKAKGVFQRFMEDVQYLHDILEEVTNQNIEIEENQFALVVGVGRIACKVGSVGNTIDSLVDAASAVKLLNSEKMIVSTGKVTAEEAKALRNVPRMAADVPEFGQAALKGPLALSNFSRGGLIGANALFLGMDVFFIYKDSISLSEGCETKVSQFLRARAALWRSELDAWEMIHDSASEGLLTSENNIRVLEHLFY